MILSYGIDMMASLSWMLIGCDPARRKSALLSQETVESHATKIGFREQSIRREGINCLDVFGQCPELDVTLKLAGPCHYVFPAFIPPLNRRHLTRAHQHADDLPRGKRAAIGRVEVLMCVGEPPVCSVQRIDAAALAKGLIGFLNCSLSQFDLLRGVLSATIVRHY